MSSSPQPSFAGGAHPVASRRRGGARQRLGLALVLALLVAAAATAGTLVAAKGAIDTVQRTDAVSAVLSPSSVAVENFLLVGSDSRANVDPSSPDAGGIGTEADVGGGGRSDTIMVLRRDRQSGAVALLSIPRDLYVTIPDRGQNRINAAFPRGADVLVSTVQSNLDIPIHHYIEIDFSGFKALVDALGGVEMCFERPVRDTHTGLFVPEPGCVVLDGIQALAYARSRHFQTFGEDSEWHEDGTADIGRTRRQREFVERALQTAVARVKANPFEAGDVMRSGAGALTVDADLDLVAAASALRSAVDGGLQLHELPVTGTTREGMSVLLLADGADQVLSFFRGDGPAPPITG